MLLFGVLFALLCVFLMMRVCQVPFQSAILATMFAIVVGVIFENLPSHQQSTILWTLFMSDN